MARHLLRDYVTQSSNTSVSTFIGSYLATIFMRRVLGYSYVGDTNYPINSVGSLLIATADSTPTGSPTFAGGTKAGINLGLNLEFNVSVPVGTRVVSSTDIGRILALRSDTNPTYNSGCFLITGIDAGSNSYMIDFRSGANITGTTIISNSSNSVSLPTATINVVSTTGFTSSGTILVKTTGGIQTVTYTGTTATSFTGCSGGIGVMQIGNTVLAQISLPQTTITVNSTAGFSAPSGTIYAYSTTGRQTITYTGTTGTTFTGCSGGTGNMLGGSPIINAITTTIAAGSNGQSLPQTTINVASTTTATTTIAAASNNVYLPTATINVASTTGFSTSGNIYITTSLGTQLVNYTGVTATTFTGCTGGTGKMTTGGSVYAGFAPSGIIYVTTSTGVKQVSYTGRTSTTFTGCSGGSGLMTTGNAVYYSANVPRIEAADSMNWYLYEGDGYMSTLAQGASNGNSSSQYRGNGTSTTPRIILQSPNAFGWQVRVCHETTNDSGVGTSPISAECALISFAPGFGGDSAGDFPVGGNHLHTPLFLNSNSLNIQGGAPGFGDNFNIPGGVAIMQYRITMVGDSDGYGVSIFGRRPGNANNPLSYFLTYGMCENEAVPLPPNGAARLFVIGSGNSQSSGNNLNNLSWYPGNITNGTAQGVTVSPAQGNLATPISVCASLLMYSTGNSSQGSPIFDGSAGDTPWFGGVELFPVDLISGTFYTWNNSSALNYGFPLPQGRFLGTIPHIREGRANYAEYSTTADLVAQHTRRGMWILWDGPPVVT